MNVYDFTNKITSNLTRMLLSHIWPPRCSTELQNNLLNMYVLTSSHEGSGCFRNLVRVSG